MALLRISVILVRGATALQAGGHLQVEVWSKRNTESLYGGNNVYNYCLTSCTIQV